MNQPHEINTQKWVLDTLRSSQQEPLQDARQANGECRTRVLTAVEAQRLLSACDEQVNAQVRMSRERLFDLLCAGHLDANEPRVRKASHFSLLAAELEIAMEFNSESGVVLCYDPATTNPVESDHQASQYIPQAHTFSMSISPAMLH